VLLGLAATFALAIGGGAEAQEPRTDLPNESGEVWELSLEEALELARVNSPTYLPVADAVESADWRVREAYASFLPTASASGALQYSGHGQQLIGSFTGDDLGAASTDYYISSYGLSVNYSLSLGQLYELRSSRAGREAAGARVEAAEFDLESRVVFQYLAARRATEAVAVARQQLLRAEQNFDLASARADAGAAPGTDALTAEVERGRMAVALVRAESAAAVERARLLEVIGVESTAELTLVSAFEVFDPTDVVAAVSPGALQLHPEIRALRESERASGANVRQAQTGYLPTLSFSAGWSGFTRQIGNDEYLLAQARSSAAGRMADCQFWNSISSGLSSPLEGYPRDCSGFVVTPDTEAEILASNEVFPFDFEKQPLSLSMRLTVPLFQGLSRQRQIEEAGVQARAAIHARRAGELGLRTEITAASGNLVAAFDVVEIESRNRELAVEQLAFAQERYRLGAAPLLELLEAQSSAATAERDYLNAVYDFHGALAELERASGLRLRPTEG
jgi:outer membrane protein